MRGILSFLQPLLFYQLFLEFLAPDSLFINFFPLWNIFCAFNPTLLKEELDPSGWGWILLQQTRALSWGWVLPAVFPRFAEFMLVLFCQVLHGQSRVLRNELIMNLMSSSLACYSKLVKGLISQKCFISYHTTHNLFMALISIEFNIRCFTISMLFKNYMPLKCRAVHLQSHHGLQILNFLKFLF